MESELDDENIVQRTTSTFNATKDSGIESADPNSYYGSDETANLGIGPNGESRILISFNNSVPSGDMVNGATLFLTCGIDPVDLDYYQYLFCKSQIKLGRIQCNME